MAARSRSALTTDQRATGASSSTSGATAAGRERAEQAEREQRHGGHDPRGEPRLRRRDGDLAAQPLAVVEAVGERLERPHEIAAELGVDGDRRRG